jgi:hypothetical protein
MNDMRTHQPQRSALHSLERQLTLWRWTMIVAHIAYLTALCLILKHFYSRPG